MFSREDGRTHFPFQPHPALGCTFQTHEFLPSKGMIDMQLLRAIKVNSTDYDAYIIALQSEPGYSDDRCSAELVLVGILE